MVKTRWLLALLVIGIGSLQAWDSHVFRAEAAVQVIVAVGLLLPALAVLFAPRASLRAAAVVVAAVLMIIARMTSSIPLPELTLAAFFAGIVVWLDLIKSRRQAACAGPH